MTETSTVGVDPNNPTGAAAVPAAANSPAKEEGSNATVPKSRFDEVYGELKTEKERARIYKEALDQSKSTTEEEKKLREQTEARVRETEQAAYKANALRGINPIAAQMVDELGATFVGNSQDEYDTWAKTMETKILPKLSSKASIDGNRSVDEPTEITPEIIQSWPQEKRLEYLRKTLPRVES